MFTRLKQTIVRGWATLRSRLRRWSAQMGTPSPESQEYELFRLASPILKGELYEWDIPRGHVTRSRGLVNLLGFLPSEVAPTPEWWLARIHPDDRRAEAEFLAAEQFEMEYRILNRAGEYITVLDRGLILHDEYGNPTRVVGYVLDITQQSRAIAERDRFFALSADILCTAALDGRLKHISSACKAVLGYAPEEMMGQLCLNWVHPEDLARTADALAQLARGDTQVNFENRYRCKDGTYKWLQWCGLVVPDQDEIYAVARDVTAQKRSQAQLRESDARLRSIFEQSMLGMAYTTVEGLYLEVNQSFCQFFGYPPEELRSLTFQDLTHPEDLDYSAHAVAQMKAGEISSFLTEKRYIRKDGEVVWGRVMVSAIRDAQGNMASMAVMLEDITARKRADLALAESQKRYADLVHSVNGIVWEFDLASQRFTLVSQKAESLLGYPIERWKTEVGFWESIIHPDDRGWVVDYCWQATASGQDHHFEYRMMAADGRTVWVEDVVTVVMEQDNPVRIRGIMLDIGDRKRIEAEREQVELILAQQLQRAQLLAEITQRIRQSLDLTTILATAVTDVRQTLQADRVLIYHLSPDRMGEIIQESVRDGLDSVLPQAWPEHSLSDACYAAYLKGRPRVVSDVNTEDWDLSWVEYAHAIGVTSKLIAPILQSGEAGDPNIWGFLVLHACTSPRTWHPAEVDLVQQIADQLAIAIQQSELYHQLQRANQNLEYLATHDKLTKIANRRSFEDVGQQEWQRLVREQMPLSLIMADLDCFKEYNDTYGHQAGDACLFQVAQAIQSALKRPSDLVARYGGEEFVIILPNTDSEGAIAVVQLIQEQVRTLAIPHVHSPVSNYVTLSLGVATVVPTLTLTLNHLIAAADRGLYQAKAQGRNRFVVAPIVSFELASPPYVTPLSSENRSAPSE